MSISVHHLREATACRWWNQAPRVRFGIGGQCWPLVDTGGTAGHFHFFL